MNTAVAAYQSVGVHGGVEAANSSDLIAMLLDGVQMRISSAKGHMERGEVAERGENISRAMQIVDGLRASLDVDAGGEIATNLDALYEYINRRLLEANIKSQPALLDEAAGLLHEIKLAWDAIPAEARDNG